MESISVLLPCYNEEEGVGICIDKINKVFDKERLDGEILVIDNGCTDNTVEVAKTLGVKVVDEPKTGYGNAYLAGFKKAKGDVIILGDADNSYDFYDIPRLLENIKDADFVIGNRIKQKGSMSLLHRIGNPIFSWLLRNLFKINISDSHCGFGAIRKEALNKLNLKSSGMEFASEILIKAKKKGLKIKEIDIDYYPRIGKSKLRSFRDGFRHLGLIARERILD
jgi:glycosyltransferase involved in cell wall biosynthesis